MNTASPIKPEEKSVEQILDDQKKPPMLKAQSTKEIKLKDSNGRGGIKFNLIDTFGFVPEEMVIQKVIGRNNAIIISAIVPDRVLVLEEKRSKKEVPKNVRSK